MSIDGPTGAASKPRETGAAGLAGWTLVVAVVVAWLAAVVSLSPGVVVPATGALAITLAVVAWRVFPASDAPARRRLPMMGLLALPWLASIACGPLGRLAPPPAASEVGHDLLLQNGLLAASVILPFAVAPMMRGGRRFTAAIGLLNACVTLIAVAASDLILAPGS